MEIILGILFIICFMIGAIEILATLLGAFAITIGWFIIVLFCLVGIVIPFFLFSIMFTSYPILTGILVIILTIWVVIFIIRKGFQGLKICIKEINRYLEERRYRKYR